MVWLETAEVKVYFIFSLKKKKAPEGARLYGFGLVNAENVGWLLVVAFVENFLCGVYHCHALKGAAVLDEFPCYLVGAAPA